MNPAWNVARELAQSLVTALQRLPGCVAVRRLAPGAALKLGAGDEMGAS